MTVDRSRVLGKNIRDIVYVASHPELQNLSVPYLSKCAGLVRESFVFAILTTNERTDRAENAMLAWRLAGMPESATDIRRVCGSYSPLAGTSKGTWNKAICIENFLKDYKSDPWFFSPFKGESGSSFRDRLLEVGIKGLALTKTTWAAQLITGGSNIACIDRHMLRLFYGRPVTNGEMNTSKKKTQVKYRHFESILVWLAKRYGWQSASALQWSVWAHNLSEIVTHDVVWGDLDQVQFRQLRKIAWAND